MSPGRRRLSARTSVLALLAGLLTTSVILWLLVVGRLDAPTVGPTLSWWVLAPLFAAAEIAVLHVQIRREAQTISLSEVPLVLALFFTPPHEMLMAAVLGSGAVYVLYRRQSAIKALFNTTLRVFGVIVVVCLAHLLAGPELVPGPRVWLAAMAAVAVAGAVDGLLVLAVVGLHDGTVRRNDALKELFRYPPISAVVGCVGLVAVTALHADPRTGPMLAVVAVALFAAYRAHASLNDQHVNLARLYDVGRSVTGTHDAQHILAGVLGAACDLLRAEAAEIVLLGSRPDDPAQRWVFAAGSPAPRPETLTADHPALWHDLPADATAQLLARAATGAAAEQLARLGYREGLVVALQDESGMLGTMLVADRMGEVRAFHAEDLPVLETVATQASLALSNARLLNRLRHEALHDVLTGLANRAKFREALDEQLTRVDDGSSPGCAVLLLDLNGFKEVNDSLGHHSGDAILMHVAQCLTRVACLPATAARLGGDEFAVLLPDTATLEQARLTADRIHQGLSEPLVIDGIEVQSRASIGIALAPAHGRDASVLLRAADTAMYSAKSSSGGTSDYEHSSGPQPEPSPVTTTRLALLAELRAAIVGDELTIHLQPQARATTGEVFAAEALIRWHHPRLGLLRPADFLALAERHGLIHELTEIVLDKAVAAASSWSAAGFDLGVAVNLAVRSLLDPRIVGTVEAALARHGLTAARLTLEITEDSVMGDPERAIAVLNALRALGVRLSVDDFGTGYSSLTYLRRLPVDEVKIDRSFVSSVDHDTDDLLITRSIIDLGANLSLEVIAEGVEDQATWDRLAALGCHGVQGDHLAPPLPAEALLIWLRGYTRAGTVKPGSAPPRPRSPRGTTDAPRR
jgi:diguanylate cyclase (GGDEF)-like protein